MIKAVIFDLDGVIADTEPLHFQSWKETLKTHDVNLSKTFFIKNIPGIGDRKAAEFFATQHSLQANVDDLVNGKVASYRQLIKKVKPRQKAINLIERLGKHFPLAIASSSPTSHVTFVLKQLNIEKKFEAVVGKDGLRPKPFPDIYLTAAKKLGVRKENCIALEDTTTGILSAKAAGMFCIACPNPYTKHMDFSKADMRLENFKRLTVNVIKNIQ